DEAQLDRVGCFKYEPVDGAEANALPDPVPEAVKEERWHRFMEAQQAISMSKLQKKIGKNLDVIIDEVTENGAVGRTKGDAPEIDGVVQVTWKKGSPTTPGEIAPGNIVKVKVTGADAYDLAGEIA